MNKLNTLARVAARARVRTFQLYDAEAKVSQEGEEEVRSDDLLQRWGKDQSTRLITWLYEMVDPAQRSEVTEGEEEA